jgi:UDP-2,4-diacetamido-2,4,6-trideoxy-beta-L-altropyranose hydrolase
MTRTILFRADGNAITGLGHLYRLFSLVEMVKDHFDVVFLTKAESTLDVIPKDYRITKIPTDISIDEEPEWINSQFSAKSYSLIADGYQFDASYQKELKKYGFTLMYIDDLASEHMFADLVINHSPYLNESDYKRELYTKLALGAQFALLRPAFLKAAKETRIIKEISTAFVCFGGADPFNLSVKAVKGLLALDSIKHIHVVLGSAYKHSGLLELANENTLTVHRNLSESELASIMQLSHLAIAPASTILYELCCVKMPIFTGFYVDNQELIYKGFLEKNVIYGGGNLKDYSSFDFTNQIKHILDQSNYDAVLTAQSMLFDDRIKERHIELIQSIC